MVLHSTKLVQKDEKKLLQFQGIKFSHLTSEEQSGQEQVGPAVNNTDSHFLKFGSSGSGKTFFLRNCLSRGKSNHVVFGRDSSEFPEQNFIPLLQLEKIGIELLANKIVVLGDAGAYKSPKTKVQDLFRFGRHHNIPVICLAHYAKDVLPVVRENCLKLYLTFNNPDNFFESIVQTFSIKDAYKEGGILHKWKQNRDQLEFGIIEFDTRSQKYKIKTTVTN